MTASGRDEGFDTVEKAIEEIKAGRPVVVVDDADRENEGDLIFAAGAATPELVAFMVTHTSGYICVAMNHDRADYLNLPPMVARNEDLRSTAYTVTVDAKDSSTGISAASRAETIRRLADPARGPEAFTRPGHIVPLRAKNDGVLARNGHTEAAADLARLAGFSPVGVLCEIVSKDNPTDMARTPELRRFADDNDLALISIAQLIDYRLRNENHVDLSVETRLPTDYGEFRAYGVQNTLDDSEHIALVCGDVLGGDEVLVRVHSECLTGDVFSSRRCDCGPQLAKSLQMVQEAGRGIIIYLRGQEGRGIGLLAKLKAYRLQDAGRDTVDANLEQGLPVDSREYWVAAQILQQLGVSKVALMTNNPEKSQALEKYGVKVSRRVGLSLDPNEDNIEYLRTKRDRMGHDLPLVESWDQAHD